MTLKQGILGLTAAGALAAMPLQAATHMDHEQKPKQEETAGDGAPSTAGQASGAGQAGGQAGGEQQQAGGQEDMQKSEEEKAE
jgi:hypothetical protein